MNGFKISRFVAGFVVVFSFLVFLPALIPAFELQAQTLPKGKMICPIIADGTRLVKGCSFEYRPALRLADARETAISDCPSGSFHDPRNGGECWSCPDGYIRNVSAVFAEDACWKAVGEDLQPATRGANPVSSCPSGSFHDPRNGGECWSCPSGYSRTWDPITSGTACHQYALGPTSAATLVTKFGCPSGTFHDPIHGGTCWSCPAEYRRTANHVESTAACAKTIPTQYSAGTYVSGGCQGAPVPTGYAAAFIDPIHDGTCWSCPVMFNRSKMHVESAEACHPGGDVDGVFVWQSPQYPEPGLYHFLGRDVLERALADPNAVDQFVTNRAGGDAAKKQAIWRRMMTSPGLSPELKALVFASLATIAESDARGFDGGRSLTNFETYARSRRMFIAQDAKNMYDEWTVVDNYNMMRAARNALGVSGVSAAVMGGGPPGFTSYAWASAGPDSSGGKFMEALHSMGQMASSNMLTVTPSAEAYSFNTDLLGPVFFALDKGIDAYRDWALTLNSLGDMLGHSAAGMGAALALVAVQQAIDLTNAITALISKEEAKQEIDSQLAEAANPVSFKEMFKTDDGKSSLLLFWALATSPYTGGDKVGVGRIDEPTDCSRNSSICTWTKWRVAQAAKVASTESMAAYQPLAANFGSEPTLSGGQIVLQNNPQTILTNQTGVAIDASGNVSTQPPPAPSVTSGTLTTGGGLPGGTVPSTTEAPKVVFDPANVTILTTPTAGWTTIPGGLVSLSVGSDGPWGINNSGNIFRYRDNTWEMLPGGASIVSAGPTGDAWVVNADGQIWRWNTAAHGWDPMPGGLVGISAGPNTVWGVNAGNQIWRYANGQWQQMPGAATAVAVGPKGDVWALGTSAVSGGKNILQWSASTNSWTAVDGGLVQISVGPDGLWGVNDSNTI
ncbi:MAG TPA: tectonin domain-containing protein, partial [Rhodothermales bacterium]|nr:tectonin domain-containing protein [Rhodothermales bacterium]